MSTKQSVEAFTDGACLGNPGPGGWGVILRTKTGYKELAGADKHTTNNRMELMGAIQALEALKVPCEVVLTTDSQYVINGATQWIRGWKARNWRSKDGSEVKNIEYWQRLDKAMAPHDVKFKWVKGHAGHAENERVDELASTAAKTQKPFESARKR